MRQLLSTIVLAATTAVFTPGSISSQTADTSRAEIRTAGTGVQRVQPNVAIVRFTFIAEGHSAKEAGRRLALRADSLRRALMSFGIPRDSLATASEWSYWGGRIEVVVSNGRFVQLPKPDSLGRLSYNLQDSLFRAHDAIEVRLRDIKKIGAVIDTALAHGITDISPVQYQASELSAARDLALKEATENARRQAEVIASASGMRLGRVIILTTQAQGGRYFEGDPGGVALMGMSIEDGGGGTEIIPRPLSVSSIVYAEWELLPKQ